MMCLANALEASMRVRAPWRLSIHTPLMTQVGSSAYPAPAKKIACMGMKPS
jgi:hypothetical protein